VRCRFARRLAVPVQCAVLDAVSWQQWVGGPFSGKQQLLVQKASNPSRGSQGALLRALQGAPWASWFLFWDPCAGHFGFHRCKSQLQGLTSVLLGQGPSPSFWMPPCDLDQQFLSVGCVTRVFGLWALLGVFFHLAMPRQICRVPIVFMTASARIEGLHWTHWTLWSRVVLSTRRQGDNSRNNPGVVVTMGA
jgi:hypothetical protein